MAISYNDALNKFLRQGIDEKSSYKETENTLMSMFR